MSSLVHWIDERIDLASLRRNLLDRDVPGGLTWWHTLGSATLAVFIVQVVTGVVLGMYYSPSPDHAYDSIRYLERHVDSGAMLRGMHHWGASAMVVLVFAHLVRVFTMGAYKYPREINWVLGVLLLVVVLGFGFTGYLLPWDQRAYWATQVGTNIAGTTPLIGDLVVKVLRGGSQLGAATLSRFFALHVLLLPLVFGVVVGVHLALVIRQGIAPRTKALEDGAPARTDDPQYAKYYAANYKHSKTAGVRFWPDIIAKDIVTAAVVIVILALLAYFAGAGLEPPADPSDTTYVPLPEWYFLPFFQLLKLVPGSMEAAVAVGLPAVLLLVLLMLPFFDRRSVRSLRARPVAAVAMFGLLGGSGLLLGESLREYEAGAPEIGPPLTAVERSGRALFKRQQCGSCHQVGKVKAEKKDPDTPDAPELTEVGLRHSTAWMHSFMEEPLRFHADSKMPAFGPPLLNHMEIEELAQYLATLRGTDFRKQPEYRDTFPEPVKPKEKP